MKLLDLVFGRRQGTASVAKDRLQIVLAQERASRTAPDFLPLLQREVLAVVSKYLEVSDDMIKVQLDRIGDTSVLEINVELDQAKVRPRQVEKKPSEEGLIAKPA